MARRANQRQRGIYTDADTGITLARDREHPFAFVFESVPVHSAQHPDANLPPLRLDAEFNQVLAIHIFDNLKMKPPGDDALYRLVRSAPDEHLPTQFQNQLWIPKSIPDSVVEPRRVEVVTADDLANTPVQDMTDAQLDALQEQVHQARQARLQREALDQPLEPDEPEFVRYMREKFGETEDRIRADNAARAREDDET